MPFFQSKKMALMGPDVRSAKVRVYPMRRSSDWTHGGVASCTRRRPGAMSRFPNDERIWKELTFAASAAS